MPNGNPSVMTFILRVLDEDNSRENISYVGMNAWNLFDCEVLPEWPRDDEMEQWIVAENRALEITWELTKARIFN